MSPPLRLRRERCRSCGALVIWALHERSGKWAPFDAKPVEGANWEIVYSISDPPRAVYVSDEQLTLGPPPRQREEPHLRNPHYATCPDASKWRRRNG